MANIGATEFYVGIPSLPREDFEQYSTQLFDEWEKYVDSVLELPDYSIALDVEEGSIKAVGRVAAALGVLYIGIGQYGSFINGLETIHKQVRDVGDYLAERAGAPFEGNSAKPRVRKRGESLARLQKTFVKVQRGEITVDQAMRESEAIFGSELEDVPDFVCALKDSLEKTTVLPRQIQLPLVDVYGNELIPERTKRRETRPSQPSQPAPIPEHYRVELWRESKKGKRNVRITNW